MFYENLVWFGLLWALVLVGHHLRRDTRQPAPSTPSPHKTPRPLKPRTPNDCPACGRPHPTPLWGNQRKASAPAASLGVNGKSPRGRRKTICTAGYACPNPDCDYHGNTDATFHALVGDGKRGADKTQQLLCQACGKCFSSRLGTALYRLRTPAAQASPRAQSSGGPAPAGGPFGRFDYRGYSTALRPFRSDDSSLADTGGTARRESARPFLP